MAPIEAAEYQRIIDFLKALDNKLRKRATLYLIGGGAITLAYAQENRTADIDAIDVDEEVVSLGGIESELAKEFGVYISPLFDITFSAPSDWRSRCRLLELDLKKLEIWVADPYDIALGKIARLELKDIEDILALTQAGQIEIDLLLDRLNDNLVEIEKFPLITGKTHYSCLATYWKGLSFSNRVARGSYRAGIWWTLSVAIRTWLC